MNQDDISVFWDDVKNDPDFMREYRLVQRRSARRDRRLRTRHRLLPFLHYWRGPYGDGQIDAKCAVCGKRVPMTAVDNWRGRIGLSA